jgi:hypothetical protein
MWWTPQKKFILSKIPFKNQTADKVQRKNVTAIRLIPSSVTYRVVLTHPLVMSRFQCVVLKQSRLIQDILFIRGQPTKLLYIFAKYAITDLLYVLLNLFHNIIFLSIVEKFSSINKKRDN